MKASETEQRVTRHRDSLEANKSAEYWFWKGFHSLGRCSSDLLLRAAGYLAIACAKGHPEAHLLLQALQQHPEITNMASLTAALEKENPTSGVTLYFRGWLIIDARREEAMSLWKQSVEVGFSAACFWLHDYDLDAKEQQWLLRGVHLDDPKCLAWLGERQKNAGMLMRGALLGEWSCMKAMWSCDDIPIAKRLLYAMEAVHVYGVEHVKGFCLERRIGDSWTIDLACGKGATLFLYGSTRKLDKVRYIWDAMHLFLRWDDLINAVIPATIWALKSLGCPGDVQQMVAQIVWRGREDEAWVETASLLLQL